MGVSVEFQCSDLSVTGSGDAIIHEHSAQAGADMGLFHEKAFHLSCCSDSADGIGADDRIVSNRHHADIRIDAFRRDRQLFPAGRHEGLIIAPMGLGTQAEVCQRCCFIGTGSAQGNIGQGSVPKLKGGEVSKRRFCFFQG